MLHAICEQISKHPLIASQMDEILFRDTARAAFLTGSLSFNKSPLPGWFVAFNYQAFTSDHR